MIPDTFIGIVLATSFICIVIGGIRMGAQFSECEKRQEALDVVNISSYQLGGWMEPEGSHPELEPPA